MGYAYRAGDCQNYAAGGSGNYAAGGYAYQAGGIFSGIGKALKGIARTALGVVGAVAPGPVGMIARAIVPQRGQAPGRVPYFPPEPSLPIGLQGGALPRPYGQDQQPVGTMLRDEFIPGCQLKGTRPNKSGYYKQVVKGDPTQVVYVPPRSVCVKARRINVANPRALRRSIRRAQGFAKLARRVLTFVGARAPKGRAKFKRKR